MNLRIVKPCRGKYYFLKISRRFDHCRDMVDLASGNDPSKLVDFLRLQGQLQGDDSGEDDDDDWLVLLDIWRDLRIYYYFRHSHRSLKSMEECERIARWIDNDINAFTIQHNPCIKRSFIFQSNFCVDFQGGNCQTAWPSRREASHWGGLFWPTSYQVWNMYEKISMCTLKGTKINLY